MNAKKESAKTLLLCTLCAAISILSCPAFAAPAPTPIPNLPIACDSVAVRREAQFRSTICFLTEQECADNERTMQNQPNPNGALEFLHFWRSYIFECSKAADGGPCQQKVQLQRMFPVYGDDPTRIINFTPRGVAPEYSDISWFSAGYGCYERQDAEVTNESPRYCLEAAGVRLVDVSCSKFTIEPVL